MRLRYSSTSFLVPKIGWNNVRTYSFQYKVCPSYWRKQPRTICIHCYPICSKLSPTSRIQVACKLLSSVGAVATVFLFLVPLSLALHRETSLVLEAWKYVDKYYVDQSIHPAWLQLRQKIIHHPGSENAHALIRDMLSTLHDPYTRLLEPEEYQSFKATVGIHGRQEDILLICSRQLDN